MKLLTVKQFSEQNNMAVSTVRDLCTKRKLPSKKVGVKWLIDQDLFEKQLEQQMLQDMEAAREKEKRPTIIRRRWEKDPFSFQSVKAKMLAKLKAEGVLV